MLSAKTINPAAANAVTQATDRLSDKIDRPLVEIGQWFADNGYGLMIGVLVAGVLVGLMAVIRNIAKRACANRAPRPEWRRLSADLISRTRLWFMIAVALDIVFTFAALPGRLDRIAHILFIIATALQVAIWVRAAVLAMIGSRVGEDPGASTLGNAMGIVRSLVSFAAFAMAGIVILDNLGVNVTTLVAGLGIGGIAIGLAAKDIFADLFAALSILFDRPFRRGELIRYGNTTATVEKIGMKTTRLRATTGEQVVIGNTKLLDQEVVNIAATHVFRNFLPFGLTYQTPTEKIRDIPRLLCLEIEAVPNCRFVRCGITGLAPSSVDLQLVYDDQSSDVDQRTDNKSRIIMAMLDRFAEQRIEFAYPTQTSFTAAPDGRLIMPYSAPAPDSVAKENRLAPAAHGGQGGGDE